MPFSSQPRKKGKVPQAEQSSACGHHSNVTQCPKCSPKKSAEIVSIPTEKKKLFDLHAKVIEKLKTDPRAIEKAAFVITTWINKKTQKK